MENIGVTAIVGTVTMQNSKFIQSLGSRLVYELVKQKDGKQVLK